MQEEGDTTLYLFSVDLLEVSNTSVADGRKEVARDRTRRRGLQASAVFGFLLLGSIINQKCFVTVTHGGNSAAPPASIGNHW